MPSVHALLPVLAVAGTLPVSWLLASRILPRVAPSVRVAGAVAVVLGAAVLTFQVLALARLFSLPYIVPLVVIAPLAILWRLRGAIEPLLVETWTDLSSEFVDLGTALRARPLVAAALAGLGALVLLRIARTLATPTFGWDDFTYHLFRAGRWVQNAGIVLEPAPDAWTYYEFFPWGGDAIWAWALVWGIGDVLVPVAAVGIWCACLVIAYLLARRLDAGPVPALTVAAGVALLPSQISQIATAYVDNLQLLLVLVCAILLLEWLGDARTSPESSRRVAGFLGLACGLGTLVKLSFLPIVALTAVAVLWTTVRRRQYLALAAFVLGGAIVVPNLAFTWYHTGSPFYPFRILEALPYNAQFVAITGQLDPADTWPRLTGALEALVINVRPTDPFLNAGVAGLLLLALAVVGATRIATSPARRAYLVWAALTAAITLEQLAAPANASMLTTWAPVLGRFVVPSLAPLLVLAVGVPSVLTTVVLPVLAVEYVLYAPWGWPRQLFLATGATCVTLAVLAVGLAALARLRVATPIRVTGAIVGAAVALSVVTAVHDRVRYGSYLAFASRLIDDFHGAGRIGTWPIWLRLEEQQPSRIAMAAGWDGVGHNWFRYGLLGARLQHEVIYVPVTGDGTIVDYADGERLAAVADRRAWLQRLSERGVQWFVALGPRTLEQRWIDELPEVFHIEMTLENGAWILARVDEQALTSLLRKARAPVTPLRRTARRGLSGTATPPDAAAEDRGEAARGEASFDVVRHLHVRVEMSWNPRPAVQAGIQ